MQALLKLKSELSRICDYFDTRRRCLYIDYPLHTNVGDLLINTGAEQFFEEHGLHIWRRYSYYDFPRRIPDLKDDDVFLLHGGGNFGDIWFNFQSFRERIMDAYPNHRIIFLPQTVHFTSSEKARASAERMNRHHNYHVFARDYRSFELLQEFGVRSVSLMPDTAHALAGVLRHDSTAKPNGVLRLLRQDTEFSSMPMELAAYNGDTYDWDHGAFSLGRRTIHYGLVRFVKGIGRYGPPIDCHSLWYWQRDHLIQDGIDLFSRYETILTNRLHAIILGLLLNKNVIAFDNNYGKLSTYCDTWLKNAEGLEFYEAATADEVCA